MKRVHSHILFLTFAGAMSALATEAGFNAVMTEFPATQSSSNL